MTMGSSASLPPSFSFADLFHTVYSKHHPSSRRIGGVLSLPLAIQRYPSRFEWLRPGGECQREVEDPFFRQWRREQTASSPRN